ncbi:hypothetical protein [Allobaculum stercoricanis]|uniref:hypothetical protein n=1 Tax=Allobaculum stercoricanis TaxID=174709 RepID=UPI0029435072|nr:hypothetical protein [Allobaculum stercoricanis]
MKEITKQIRKEVKELIEKYGGTAKIPGTEIVRLTEKYGNLTTIVNQIDYFKYSKGL